MLASSIPIVKNNLMHQPIKCYLSAVQHLQITAGMDDPFREMITVLEYILKCIKGEQAWSGPAGSSRTCQPPHSLKQPQPLVGKQVDPWPDRSLILQNVNSIYYGWATLLQITSTIPENCSNSKAYSSKTNASQIVILEITTRCKSWVVSTLHSGFMAFKHVQFLIRFPLPFLAHTHSL